MTVSKAERSRLSAGLVVLLAVISLANVFALVVALMLWEDEASHGGDLVGLAVFSALLSVIGLVGIGGAWARREWGPTLYLGAQATGLVFVLIAQPAALGPLTFVPLLLAGVLWALTR
jgi:hypothetical protein